MKYLVFVFAFIFISCGHISQMELERPLEPNVEAMAFKTIDGLLEKKSPVKKMMTFTNSNFNKRELVITMLKNDKKDVLINISTKGQTQLATISNNPVNNQIKYIPEKYLNILKNFILTDFILVHGPSEFINKELTGFKVFEDKNERKIQRNGIDFAEVSYVDEKTISVNNIANKYKLMIQEI